jgi:FtsH-binding integral membrane protein
MNYKKRKLYIYFIFKLYLDLINIFKLIIKKS